MNAQKELKSVSLRNSFLSTLSNILYVIGVIAILAGVINFFIGIDYADSFIDEKRYLANSYKTIGIGSAFSGFCLFFFGAIGKAINEIKKPAFCPLYKIRSYTATYRILGYIFQQEARNAAKKCARNPF